VDISDNELTLHPPAACQQQLSILPLTTSSPKHVTVLFQQLTNSGVHTAAYNLKIVCTRSKQCSSVDHACIMHEQLAFTAIKLNQQNMHSMGQIQQPLFCFVCNNRMHLLIHTHHATAFTELTLAVHCLLLYFIYKCQKLLGRPSPQQKAKIICLLSVHLIFHRKVEKHPVISWNCP